MAEETGCYAEFCQRSMGICDDVAAGIPDEKLLMILARVAERRVREFNAQAVAKTAWAFATLK